MTEHTFPGTLDSLEPIRDLVAKHAAAAGLDRNSVYKLCLAVDEIATNIITHGYGEAGLSGEISVRATALDDSFQVDLLDSGRAYDPWTHDQQSGTDLDLSLDQRRIGGLGILLARDSVDDLQYRSDSDRNVHRFIVKRDRNVK
jgi:anti-sigma regulatory factor (Ser/Thr protein kinase)